MTKIRQSPAVRQILLEPELDKIEAEMKQWKQQDEDVLILCIIPAGCY